MGHRSIWITEALEQWIDKAQADLSMRSDSTFFQHLVTKLLCEMYPVFRDAHEAERKKIDAIKTTNGQQSSQTD